MDTNKKTQLYELQEQNNLLFQENLALKASLFKKSEECEDLNNALKQALRKLGRFESLQNFVKQCRVVGSILELEKENIK